jgi:hypothetical protein
MIKIQIVIMNPRLYPFLILIILLACSVSAQSPCKEPKYLKLQKIRIDEMSQSQYKHYIQPKKECENASVPTNWLLGLGTPLMFCGLGASIQGTINSGWQSADPTIFIATAGICLLTAMPLSIAGTLQYCRTEKNLLIWPHIFGTLYACGGAALYIFAIEGSFPPIFPVIAGSCLTATGTAMNVIPIVARKKAWNVSFSYGLGSISMNGWF